MVRFDFGDVDPWVPFLAELRQSQTGEPVEVWLLNQTGDRQTTKPTATEPSVTTAEPGPRIERHSESVAIPVRHAKNVDRESCGETRNGRLASVRFGTGQEGRPSDA